MCTECGSEKTLKINFPTGNDQKLISRFSLGTHIDYSRFMRLQKFAVICHCRSSATFYLSR